MKPVALPQANPLTLRNRKYAFARPSLLGMPRPIHLWHLASLDAPTVAVVWTIAFASVAGVPLNPWITVLIACGSWTVYVGDRLLDARRAIHAGQLGSLRERHYFHWRHRRWLIPSACATAAIASTLIVIRTPSAVRHRDSILAAATLIYFSGVHSPVSIPHWIRRHASKEFLVGLLFTAGCAAPTLSRLHSVRWPLVACLSLFTALAWLNCSAIEKWELPEHQTRILPHATILGAICFTLAASLLFVDANASALACAAGISAILLAMLDHARAKISPLTLRTLADSVLLTPLILIVMQAWRG